VNTFFIFRLLSVGNKKRTIFNKEGVDLSRMFFKELGDVVKRRTGERIAAENVKNVVSFSELEFEISSITIKVKDFETIFDISKDRFSINCF